MRTRKYYYKQLRKQFPLYPAIRCWNCAKHIIDGRMSFGDAKHFAATFGKTYSFTHWIFGGKP